MTAQQDSTPCMYHSGLMAELKAVCRKIESLEKGIEKQLEMAEKAIIVARQDMERRLEAMNEFRAQLSRQASEFAGRKEVELMISKLDTKIDSMEVILSERKGKAVWADHIVTVLIAALIMILGHFIFKL